MGAERRAGSDEYKERQKLVQLRVETITIQRKAAEAEKQRREQELAELRKGSRENEKARALARREAAKALSVYAKQRYDRTLRLLEKKGASEEEVAEVRPVTPEELDAMIAGSPLVTTSLTYFARWLGERGLWPGR